MSPAHSRGAVATAASDPDPADQVRITVNRQFAEPFTRLDHGDEVGLVPTSPVAPATPGLI